MFGDNKLCQAPDVVALCVFTAFCVIFRAVNEAHDVGILLYGSRLSKVGKHRAFVIAGLSASIKLREGNDRDVQFLRKGFKRTRYRAHLLLAAAEFHACGIHELKVVNHNQSHAFFSHKSPRLCAELSD